MLPRPSAELLPMKEKGGKRRGGWWWTEWREEAGCRVELSLSRCSPESRVREKFDGKHNATVIYFTIQS